MPAAVHDTDSIWLVQKSFGLTSTRHTMLSIFTTHTHTPSALSISRRHTHTHMHKRLWNHGVDEIGLDGVGSHTLAHSSSPCRSEWNSERSLSLKLTGGFTVARGLFRFYCRITVQKRSWRKRPMAFCGITEKDLTGLMREEAEDVFDDGRVMLSRLGLKERRCQFDIFICNMCI